MNSIHKDANLRYIGTEVYISYIRKRYVAMDLKTRSKWANEYHKTLEECVSFCEVNGFKIVSSPSGEESKWPSK